MSGWNNIEPEIIKPRLFYPNLSSRSSLAWPNHTRRAAGPGEARQRQRTSAPVQAANPGPAYTSDLRKTLPSAVEVGELGPEAPLRRAGLPPGGQEGFGALGEAVGAGRRISRVEHLGGHSRSRWDDANRVGDEEGEKGLLG
ncbi:hypothetical protein HPP92_017831 [Vanilla planifolia]|uniref:Uncharacterized protein n=1 Tax=Vanilla planifolia TaxID=51239 RepID=A0A835UNY6_VANPL|nr:hypothetical protein HPP92_017831 [Vanilla planifolia]